MTFKAAICDDEQRDIDLLHSFLTDYSMQYEVQFEVTEYTSSSALLAQYTSPNCYHLLFLDVEMPDCDGLALAKQIRSLPDHNVKIIFISNYPNYMQDSFNVEAFHYLQKPLQYKIFQNVMHRIIQNYKETHIARTLLYEDDREEVVYYSNIICVTSIKNDRTHVKVMLTDETVIARGQLTQWEQELSDSGFVSPCRGYLVNLSHIHYFKNHRIVLTNNFEIPVSRRKETEIKKLFSLHLFHS